MKNESSLFPLTRHVLLNNSFADITAVLVATCRSRGLQKSAMEWGCLLKVKFVKYNKTAAKCIYLYIFCRSLDQIIASSTVFFISNSGIWVFLHKIFLLVYTVKLQL